MKISNRFARWATNNMPTREGLERNRFARPFAKRILRSDLWRFNRRSVPRGVALGMLVGIIVPFAQILFAALLCVNLRANVPVAGLTTFITNPFTTPFIWVIAYKLGESILRFDSMLYTQPVSTAIAQTDVEQMIQWLTGHGLALGFGLIVLAVIASAVSYLLASFLWRGWIMSKRRARLANAAERRLARMKEPAA